MSEVISSCIGLSEKASTMAKMLNSKYLGLITLSAIGLYPETQTQPKPCTSALEFRV